VVVEGARKLAGIAHLPEIGWYEITLLDLGVLLPASQFSGLMLIYVLGMAILLLAFNVALNRLVVRPLGSLSAAVDYLRDGKAHAPGAIGEEGSGEFRRLMRQFQEMAAAVLEARRDLEAKVQERTVALDRLTKIDALTELLNRRGISERLEAELDRAAREGSTLGVLWIDIDRFKDINDRHGHAVGDQALKAVAAAIQQAIRKYDVASRWGGDEFLVLTFANDQENLDRVGERVRAAIAACRLISGEGDEAVSITASVGGQLAAPTMSLEALLRAGDDSLYAAKAAGRNRYHAIALGRKA
jgi:diguanylate cyclase (GGDEF)-like protein